MKKKRATRKPPKWRRSAAVPVQMYLTDETNAKLCDDAAAAKRSKSEHMRLLIENYKQPKPRRPRARKPPPTAAEPVDPRQTNIEDITTRPEGEALRAWAEREGRSDWLQENLS